MVSTLFRMTTFAAWKTPGYLSGLSSPSGTDKIMTLAFSPRSKSVGHTRLPTFSTMIRSRRSRSSTSMARLIMLDSRWHAPPVLICTAAMPWALIFSASTLLAMSPSMTAMLNSSRSASMVARMVDVLPEPGLASRSSTNTWLSAKRLRSCAASWSFLSRMGCFISICMLNPPIDQAAVSVMNRIGKARRMHVAFRLRPMGKRLPAHGRGFAGTATR